MAYLTLLITFVTAIIVTPIVIKLSFKFGATDKPDKRKVHQKEMPRIGGVAIYIAFLVGCYVVRPIGLYYIPILIGSFIIFFTGLVDDLYNIRPRYKLLGQLLATAVVVIGGGLELEFVNLPFGGELHLGMLSIPITFFWIVGITNALNLIDGLDGLAAGVSFIVLVTMASLAATMGNWFVFAMCLALIGSTSGFLVFNFYPAKIFMGDSGSLLLGFMIAVLSLLGFKNATVISFIVPMLILGVPIADTLFAIIRRVRERKPISAPDKSHLHHCLLQLGYSHRQTVLMIYGISAVFGVLAVVFSKTNLIGAITLLAVVLTAVEIFAERIGLIHENYRPILNIIKSIRYAGALKKN